MESKSLLPEKTPPNPEKSQVLKALGKQVNKFRGCDENSRGQMARPHAWALGIAGLSRVGLPGARGCRHCTNAGHAAVLELAIPDEHEGREGDGHLVSWASQRP